eukprot:COSAG06_NODE_11967_length_1441_cov_1.103577_1_plen_231_part_10
MHPQIEELVLLVAGLLVELQFDILSYITLDIEGQALDHAILSANCGEQGAFHPCLASIRVALINVSFPLPLVDLVARVVHHTDLDPLAICICEEALRNIDQPHAQQLNLALLRHDHPNIHNDLVVVNVAVLRRNGDSFAVAAAFVAVELDTLSGVLVERGVLKAAVRAEVQQQGTDHHAGATLAGLAMYRHHVVISAAQPRGLHHFATVDVRNCVVGDRPLLEKGGEGGSK